MFKLIEEQGCKNKDNKMDFLSEKCASRKAKLAFLSFVVRELLTFEFCCVESIPPWAINQKILPGPNRVKANI